MELTKKEIETLKGVLENFCDGVCELEGHEDSIIERVWGELFSELEEFVLETKQTSFDDGKEIGFDEGYSSGVSEDSGF